jgi:UDP-3-O-[3-hydroxymyristoyl] glucosamine N-acyltransferase
MRSRFFDKKYEFLTISRVLEITGSTAFCEYDLDEKIYDISTLERAKKSDISFLSSTKYLDQFKNSSAGFCICDLTSANKAREGMKIFVSKDSYFAYSLLVKEFYCEKNIDFVEEMTLHRTTNIHETAKIAPSAYIGKYVEIGENCFIGANAVIMDGCKVGEGTIINAGAVISFATIGKN